MIYTGWMIVPITYYAAALCYIIDCACIHKYADILCVRACVYVCVCVCVCMCINACVFLGSVPLHRVQH